MPINKIWEGDKQYALYRRASDGSHAYYGEIIETCWAPNIISAINDFCVYYHWTIDQVLGPHATHKVV